MKRLIYMQVLPLGADVVRAERPEEGQIEQALRDGSLVYLRGPRKIGKSSLAVLVEHRLKEAGKSHAPAHVFRLDFQAIGDRSEEHFLAVAEERLNTVYSAVARAVGLADARAEAIRRDAGSGPDWFWRAAAKATVEAACRVIFVQDEIEGILERRATFGEPWLIGLRQAHQDTEGRLTALLVGRLPIELLVASPERTPFNTALEVVLSDLDREQLEHLAAEVGPTFRGADLSGLLAHEIYERTAGQPNLSMLMLRDLQIKYKGDTEEMGRSLFGFLADFVKTNPECQPGSQTYQGVTEAFDQVSVWPAGEALTIYAQMFENAEESGSDRLPMVGFDPWSSGQRMLEAVGLAKVERNRKDGQDFLVARSQISLKLFDADWVKKRLMGLPGLTRPAGADSPGSEMLRRMEFIAREELCGTDWARKHEASIVDGSGRELVEGALFEFELVHRNPVERLTLQLFYGVGPFGQLLWQRQIRTLRRLGGQSSALPNIRRGGSLDEGRVAYVITQRPQYTLADPLFLDYLHRNRHWAIRQLRNLAIGLDRLISEGVTHRNIWPGAIRVDLVNEVKSLPEFKLSGFEFSVMLRSFLAGIGEDPSQILAERRSALQRAFLRQPPAGRPYAPPEFLEGLFGSPDTPVPALARSDIFSLGMMAATWFLAPPDPAAFAPVLKEVGPGKGVYSAADHKAYVEAVHAQILGGVRSHRIPRALADILLRMTVFEYGQRPTPEDIVTAIDASESVLLGWATGVRKPLLACYHYQETAIQLRSFRLTTSALDTSENRRDVEAFMQRELRNARLFYSARGAAPFVSEPDPGHHKAKWVLMGANWLFYCSRFERRLGPGPGAATPHILRIGYVLPMNRLWRRLPPASLNLGDSGTLVIVERFSPEVEAEDDGQFARWDPLLDAACANAAPPSFEIAEATFDWLIDAQLETLELQSFPVRAVGSRKGRTQHYELDLEAYRKRLAANRMRAAVVQSSGIRDERNYFEQVLLDSSGRNEPLRLRQRGSGHLWSNARAESISVSSIEVECAQLPSKAMLQPRSLGFSRSPVWNQRAALTALRPQRALFDQLLQPYVVVDDDTADDSPISAAVEGLAGRSAEIVKKLVSTSPMSALQGPPGSGKTTVIAAVIRSLLAIDNMQRILVTSQSHAAVDNIAFRVKELGLNRDLLCVRVAADVQFEEGERIDPEMREWRPEELARRRADKIRAECGKRRQMTLEPALERANDALADAVAAGTIELKERICEGASVVFATTAGTKRLMDDDFLAHGKFDMAIVDEASKAWPTEILQALLLADRQILVGDHYQLPAFGTVDVERLLQICIDSDHPEFRLLANHERAVKAWLKLFASFFTPSDAPNEKFVPADDTDTLLGWRDKEDVIERLDLQFRMRRDIAEVVSQTFYGGKLITDPSVDARPRPAWLAAFADELGADRNVIWIDTDGSGLFANQSAVTNEGQARLAARLLSRAAQLNDPAEAEGARKQMVALSPYQRQNKLIEKALAERGGGQLAPYVSTVDSFQGHEANLAILALTRGPSKSSPRDGATRRYGFLVTPERANVMFSRARELVVVLGDFRFFAEAEEVEQRNSREAPIDLSFWTRLCEQIGRNGRVIAYDDLPRGLRIE